MKENLLLLKDSFKPCKIKFISYVYNVYIDKLDYIRNKYNNKYHRTTKMKPVNIKSSTYIDSSKEINDKDCKFKIVDIATISK